MRVHRIARWLPIVGLTATTFLLRRQIAARIPGTRANRLRRSARSDFTRSAATRLVAAGLPTAHGARIWVRSDRAGPHRLTLVGPDGTWVERDFLVPGDPALDGTTVVRWPQDVGAPDLEPRTSYRYVVTDARGSRVGEGRLTTAPLGETDAPDAFAFAIGSCHQPFDDEGHLRPESLGLLRGLIPALESHGVEGVLLLGDQMYTDLPAGQCLWDDAVFARFAPPGRKRLLDCTRAEVRALFQQRYRAFWKVEAFRALQSRFPSSLILDDHELIDNFGTSPAHRSPEWQEVAAGALDAFHDYQGLRMHDRPRPTTFDTRFAWGPLAALVLDLRSQRRVEDGHGTRHRIRVLTEAQWTGLERFLEEEARRPVLFLGLSVPLLHVPEWMVQVGVPFAQWGSGVHDRWSHPGAAPDRDRLVHLLARHRRRHPEQRVLLVSGDVHVGTVSRLTFGESPSVTQVVSSAMSNLERLDLRYGSAGMADITPKFHTAEGMECVGELLPGLPDCQANPYTGLNVAVIGFKRHGAGWRVRIRLLGESDGRVAPVYDSGEI